MCFDRLKPGLHTQEAASATSESTRSGGLALHMHDLDFNGKIVDSDCALALQ
jgi:hypothetical protein